MCLAALFIYPPQCLQSFLLTTFAPFLGLHHSSSIQHNVGIMRSVWLALLNGWQRNNITKYLHHHKIRNANQATVRAHAPHNLRYVKCRLRYKVAASCKAKSFTWCTLTCIANLRGNTFSYYQAPPPRAKKAQICSENHHMFELYF